MRGEGQFIRGTIKYKKIVYLILFLLVAVGVYGLAVINKDEFPTFEIKEGLVVGIYPGASAAEVEAQLTKPLEDLLFSFSEVDRGSYSYSRDGICYIYVELTSPASKKDEVWSKIRHSINQKKQLLPPGVLAVAVLDDFSSVSSALITVESEDKSYSELQEYADALCDRLHEIPDLAKATIYGGQSEEIAVHLDMEKLSAYGISPSMLMLDYQTSGMMFSSGKFETEYASSPIHISSLVNSEKEVADKIVYADSQGNIIRLKDIATVERRYKEPSSLVNYNGHTALIISVEMRPDNNIVVLGMIVDDSIITMDGYMDKLGRGMDRVDAACASAKELFPPMLLATSAIGLMFFPIIGIITGYLGDFVKSFPWIIAFSLGTSLIYAVTVVPSLEVKYIKTARATGDSRFVKIQNKFFDLLQSGYDRMQAICFRHPYVTLAAGVVAVVLGVLMFLQLNIQMMPMAERDCFAVEIYLDANAGLDKTEVVSDSLQNILLADERVKSVTAFVGTGAPRFHATYIPKQPGANFAQFIVNIRTSKETEAVLREYGTKYEHYFPEAQIRFKQMDYQGVTAPVAVTFKGGTVEQMKPYSDSLRAYMAAQTDLMKWVHSDFDEYISTVEVDMDTDEAARLGINRTLLSLSLSSIFNGQTIATVWEGNDAVPVTLYSDSVTDDMSYDTVENQMVPTYVPGVSVPLRQVASVSPGWEPETIPHIGGKQTVTVYADMMMGRSQPEAMRKIEKYVEEKLVPVLPEGVTIEYGGLSGVNNAVIPEILLSFICAVAVLFFFLLFHFKKISLAVLSIVLSMLCLFGASFGLWVYGFDFGITSVLGLISLVGIIVRNGIIMFEYAEELRFKHGLSVKEAAEESGKRRMRPIFLTSCTTALGVLPMIISRDALWMPMGVVICFGTMLSIFLIVFIMPVSYWQIFKHSENEVPATDTIEEGKGNE